MCLDRDLVPEAELVDDLPVAVDVRPLQVLEKATSPADHLEQPSTAVMVLGVLSKVVGQIVDPLGQHGNLDARGTGVALVSTELLDRRCFFEGHDIIFPAGPTAPGAPNPLKHSILLGSPTSVKARRFA